MEGVRRIIAFVTTSHPLVNQAGSHVRRSFRAFVLCCRNGGDIECICYSCRALKGRRALTGMNDCLPVRRSDKFKEAGAVPKLIAAAIVERVASAKGIARTMCGPRVSCASYLAIPAHLSPESNIH